MNIFSDTRYILYLAIKDFLFFTKMQDMSGWIKHVTLYVKNFSFYFDIKTVAALLSKAVNRRLVYLMNFFAYICCEMYLVNKY